MPVQEITFYSKALNKDSCMRIYHPDVAAKQEPFPVLYFLHGRSGDETIMEAASLAETADAMIKSGEIQPLIIVCPRMENSRGINSSDTCKSVMSPDHSGVVIHLGRYEDYLLQDVLPLVASKFSVQTNRAERYVGGASAGGYAALHQAFRHPDLFSKVGGHMPALELTLAPEDAPYFSSTDVWNKYDPITIAKQTDLPADLLIYLDAGSEDEGQFYEGCAILHDILQNKGICSQNHVFEGHHTVAYIQNNIRNTLHFMVSSSNTPNRFSFYPEATNDNAYTDGTNTDFMLLCQTFGTYRNCLVGDAKAFLSYRACPEKLSPICSAIASHRYSNTFQQIQAPPHAAYIASCGGACVYL